MNIHIVVSYTRRVSATDNNACFEASPVTWRTGQSQSEGIAVYAFNTGAFVQRTAASRRPCPIQRWAGRVECAGAGVAERKLVVKNANTPRKTPITKKSAPIVARPVTEEVEILFIGRSLLISALRFGKMDGGGRLFVLVFFPTALQALECLLG